MQRKTNRIFNIFLLAAVLIAGNVQADRSQHLREGMRLGEAIAVMGEPLGRVDMETRRETRLLYPGRSFRFVDGLLVDLYSEIAVPKSPLYSAGEGSAPSSNSARNKSKEARSVKLEAVLNEVMKSKGNGSADASPSASGTRAFITPPRPSRNSMAPIPGEIVNVPMGGPAMMGREDQLMPLEADIEDAELVE